MSCRMAYIIRADLRRGALALRKSHAPLQPGISLKLGEYLFTVFSD